MFLLPSQASDSFLFSSLCPQQLMQCYLTFHICDKCLNMTSSLCLFFLHWPMAHTPNVCIFSPCCFSKSTVNTYSKQTQPASFTFYKRCPPLIKHLAFPSTIPAEKRCPPHCRSERGWGVSLHEEDSTKIATLRPVDQAFQNGGTIRASKSKTGAGGRKRGVIWG